MPSPRARLNAADGKTTEWKSKAARACSSTLHGFVAIGAVELHPGNGIVENIERADRLVIDLDPGESIRRAAVIGITWPIPDELDDPALERKLFAPAGYNLPRSKPLPDWPQVHAELRRAA